MRVGLVQINNSFSGQNYLPYSVGILQAYAQQHLAVSHEYEFLPPLYKRIALDDALEALRSADIVGFSLYVWNQNISLEIARRLKEQNPAVTIVFGGPQVPDRSELFLRAHPWVDVACHNEGEQVFTRVLERASVRDWYGIPSTSFITQEGQYVQNERMPRIPDLSLIPSPYTSGVFSQLMAEHPEEQWLFLWETNRGCPFACTFCDWGSAIASKVFRFDESRLYAELEWVAAHKIEFMFCCDANFGIFPRDVEIARYAASVKARVGYPHALSVQNAKNAEERIFQAQKILADAGLNKGVTLAFQSLDPVTLESIKRRNISLEDFRRLQKRFTAAGIETYSDLILALPGETYETFVSGVSEAIASGQHNRIQFSNCSILPNAEMGDPGYQVRFGIQSVSVEAVIYHGVIDTTPDQIREYEDLVIATDAMPREDWVRARVFSWMTALLHFDKLFQIPLVVLQTTTSVSYRELIEVFTEGSLAGYPVLAEIRSFFQEKARSIQGGDIEQCPAPEWLNVYWPPDEYIFIKLAREGKLAAFYQEASSVLARFFSERSIAIPASLLADAVLLNQSLVKLPFQTEDVDLSLRFNVWEVYYSARRMLEGSEEMGLKECTVWHHIDRTTEQWSTWEDWMQHVVWYGNKKGAYLYGTTADPEREGHY